MPGKLTRRNFASTAALAATASMLGLPARRAGALPVDAGYKALVCVFLFGGNDSFNTLVPTDAAGYTQYSGTRDNLAIPQSELLPIGGGWGLHPQMTELADLYNRPNSPLAIVANVGALHEPLTRDQYLARSASQPRHLFSHNSQQEFWQTLHVSSGSGAPYEGWGGLAADQLGHFNQGSSALPMSFSLAGNQLFSIGQSTTPFILSPAGVVRIDSIDADSSERETRLRSLAFTRLLRNPHNNLFGREYARKMSDALGLAEALSSSIPSPGLPIAAPLQGNATARALTTVAEVISASSTLGFGRQIFFVGVGGWDTHSNQLQRQANLLAELSAALRHFHTTLGSAASQVTTFTASDFGRSLASNGDGTDHGWGGHHFVMGDAVAGGQIYGTMPSLELGGADDSGDRGRMIPTLAVDQYAATLARWFGIDTPSELDSLFPSLANFTTRDLGFMV